MRAAGELRERRVIDIDETKTFDALCDLLDLGNPIEFNSGVELAYRFAGQSRLGLAFDHISNAGIAKINPGVESLLLVYSYPLGGT